ncbi:MAG: hypothetical protein QOH12_2691 [Solirubrobacteraceae bacterium]|jgi:hypothetical protein|nr:hypothetical protein [Solirubrobacteraceae bacterium]
MLRPVRLPIALSLAALGAVSALPASSAVAAPVARASASCTASTATLAGGYFIPKSKRGVSCATQKGLEAGFQACRLKHGGQKGKCSSKILGFVCKEGKRSAIPTNFFATVTCTKAKALFSYVYEQNTL